jgi:hypothetical protein
MLADLEREVRPLLADILASLSDLLDDHGNDTVRRFLADAPVDLCVRLADTWALAADLGLDPRQLMPRFSPEEQFLLELVTAIYTAGRPAGPRSDSFDLSELVGLLDQTCDDPVAAGV